MSYLVAERFKSVQGEGLWAGTPMAFIRFVGCSVGKRVCNACDTDFEKTYRWRGGADYTLENLMAWAEGFEHVCFTGGEPLDQDLRPFLEIVNPGEEGPLFHIETSGTVLMPELSSFEREQLYICVSPKPGYREEMVELADEIKVIVPGLGAGDGWPDLDDALHWAARLNKPVFLQPRNAKHEVDRENLALCEQLVLEHPELRLSVQLHKILRVR